MQRSDIVKIIEGRHGDPCAAGAPYPGEAMELAYLKAVMPVIIATKGRWRREILQWAASYVPTLHGHYGEERISHMADACFDDRKRRFTTDQLSRLLKVTEEEMVAFGLNSIRHMKSTATKRKVADKTRRRVAQQARRAAVPGHKPRAQSNARTKPWDDLGMSKSSYYAKGLNKGREAVRQDENTVERVPEPEHLDCFVPCNTGDDLDCFVPHINVPKGLDTGNDNHRFLDALPY